MEIGLYFDLRDPHGGSRGWARTYGFVLEMCQEAERLGIRSVWFTEHHGFDDGYLPQPLVFAAAVAARTSRLRIGTAVLIAPFRDPLHIAEEAAVVDLVSEGRLELGIGAGYRHAEFAMFGVDRSSRLAATTRAASELRTIWRGSQATPAPHQDPVPLWLGFNGPRGAAHAGRLGEGLLSIDPALLRPYRDGLVQGGHDPAGARMAGLVPAYASDDPERDWPVVAPLHAAQWDSYLRHAVEGTDAPPPPPVDPERARAAGLEGANGNLLFGEPEDVSRRIRDHLVGLPVHHLLMWAALPGQSEESVVQNIRTIATEVAPRLREDVGTTS